MVVLHQEVIDVAGQSARRDGDVALECSLIDPGECHGRVDAGTGTIQFRVNRHTLKSGDAVGARKWKRARSRMEAEKCRLIAKVEIDDRTPSDLPPPAIHEEGVPTVWVGTSDQE